jgi:signal peptidase I
MIVLKWLFFIAVGAIVEHYVFPLVNVCGNSMFPTYHDGEIILSRRIFRKNKIKPGDVMVFKHPTVKNRLLIKRVSEVFRDRKVKFSPYTS